MVETKVKPTLHTKLAQVMYEAERIPKNGTAPTSMGGYKFVQVGDAADYIRKALAEQQISMMPTAVEVIDKTEHATKAGGSMTTVDLRVTWTLTDGESGETATIQSYGAGADGGDKYSGKATTSAMKYALLAGFLLSTGEDTELHATPDRGPRQDPTPRPELERRAEGLLGKVAVGKVPVDLNLRQTPDGPAWGFKLTAGNKGYQALAIGPLADALAAAAGDDFVGKTVEVWGHIDMVPWTKKEDGVERNMPPYARIAIEKVQTPDWTLPSVEAETVPLFPDGDPFPEFE